MGRATWSVVAAVAMAAGVALASPAPAAVGPLVQMVDNEPDLTNWHFDPAQLTVPAGSTVVWHNRGKEEHSVTADDKSFDSGYKKPGTDFQRVFPRIGKFSYHCAPHPWMTGVIQVVAAPTTTTTVPVATTAAAAAPGSATTTLPPSLAAQAPGQPGQPGQPGGSGGSGGSATTAAPGATTTAPASGASGSSSAAPAGKRSHSRAGLAGAIAVVLIPTVAALAIGARVRRSRERRPA